MTHRRRAQPDDPKRVDEDLGRDDEGIGSVRPDEVVPIDPEDEGIGSVRPEEAVPIAPDDEGIGSVRPEEVVPLDPDDEGLGSVRPGRRRASSRATVPRGARRYRPVACSCGSNIENGSSMSSAS